jgi:hypothetical protein
MSGSANLKARPAPDPDDNDLVRGLVGIARLWGLKDTNACHYKASRKLLPGVRLIGGRWVGSRKARDRAFAEVALDPPSGPEPG